MVNYYSKIPLKKISPHVLSPPEKTRLNVQENIVDRIKRIDTHAIWSVMLFQSSKKARDAKINTLSGIGYYYSLFHCIFSLISLDFEIIDSKLSIISHNQLTNYLKKQAKMGIVTQEFVDLFNDARSVREYVNYLSGKTGHEKFLFLRHPVILETKLFGKIRYIDFIKKLDYQCDFAISEYLKLLQSIERKYSTSIFPILHRKYDFDYYGEDFLENFFEPDCELIRDVEKYLESFS